MKAEIMTEFETMRADLEAELAEARERVAETAADAAAADAARLDAVAVRDAMQLAVGPLGETIGAPIALRLADKSRAVAQATGNATRAKLLAEFARTRVVELEAAITQIQHLIDPPQPEPELIDAEAGA